MERETIRYYKIKDAHKEYQFVYSINEIERIIYEKFMWQRLEKIYVGLQGYLYSNTYDDNLIDLSYMGGCTRLVFDNGCLDLCFSGDGMLEYRIIDKLTEVVEYCDKIDEYKEYERDCYFDVSQQFTIPFENQKLMKLDVFGTDGWLFSLNDFNEKKAKFYADMNKLPSRICFKLENGNVFYLQGDEIEYYYIVIEDDYN